METIEASIVLKGMKIRVMEVLNDRLVSIQKDTETAVNNAVNDYDFDGKIGEIVTEWLDETIRGMSITIADNAMFSIENEMSRVVHAAVKKAIEDKLNEEINNGDA